MSAPLVDLLQTASNPSEADITAVRSLLSERSAQLLQVEAQITEMRAALDQLTSTRDSLQTEIELCEALLAPIRRLPEDVLAEIFLACLPTKHNALIHPSHPPLLFGRVCRYWRHISHATPRLWSSLHISSLSNPSDDLIPPHVAAAFESTIATWLGRSRACPLSISYIDTFSYFDDPSNILQHLLPIRHRIRQLDLWETPNAFTALLDDVPALESFSALGVAADWTFWTNASALQNQKLKHFALRATTEYLSLPLIWENMTDLTLSPLLDSRPNLGLDQNMILTLLRRCPNLIRCDFTVTQRNETELVVSSTISLPALELMGLGCSAHVFQSRPAAIIAHLDAPKLRFLGVGEDVKTPTLRLLGVPSEVWPTLTVADHGGFIVDVQILPQLPPDAILDLLRVLPRTTDLCISLPDPYPWPWNHQGDSEPTSVASWFFQALAGSSYPDMNDLDPSILICPRLTHLALFCGSDSLSETSFISFIRTRIASRHPLRSLNLETQDSGPINVRSELEDFVNAGLQLKVEYPPAPQPPPSHWRYNPMKGLNSEPVYEF